MGGDFESHTDSFARHIMKKQLQILKEVSINIALSTETFVFKINTSYFVIYAQVFQLFPLKQWILNFKIIM